jgi:hypothetical protein
MVSGYTLPTLVETELDAEINDWGLPKDVVPVVKEELGIRFGSALTKLWSNCRPLVGEEDYLRYDADIPALWERTEYVPYPKIQTNQSSFQSPFYSFTKISRTFY